MINDSSRVLSFCWPMANRAIGGPLVVVATADEAESGAVSVACNQQLYLSTQFLGLNMTGCKLVNQHLPARLVDAKGARSAALKHNDNLFVLVLKFAPIESICTHH